MWVVTGHWLWCNLSIGISEVDVSHVISIVQEIWVESIIVPSVVRIVLALPMSLGHPPGGPSQTVGDVGPENWSQKIEPGVDWTHKFIVWMGSKTLVSQKIWESVLELINSMLHQAERAEGEDTHPWYGVGSPVSIEIHLHGGMEHTISTFNGISLNPLPEISWLCWQLLNFIDWRSCITFIKAQE